MRTIRTKSTIAIVFCLTAVFLAVGCAATKKITGEIMGKGSALKKKIAFLPTVNKTGYGGKEFQESARVYMNDFLKRFCDDIINIDSRKTRNLLGRIPRFSFGRLDNLALAELGRSLGLNAVLEESLSEIRCVEDKRGIWGFRDICMFVQISVRVRGYDVQTGAVFFDEFFHDEVEISEQEWEDINKTTGYKKETVDWVLAKITPEISKRICYYLGNEPWKGYITSVSKNTFTITAGKDVGLATGDVLEVMGPSKTIKGHGGQAYLVSGPKIGELKITKIYRDRAEAIGVLGSDLQKSSYVKLKQ
ncbi:MAG: hypothetical protein HWN69_03020 [Desulfobacterales bacterium]|nr:hypothetical protein [Desulfobacterales bacterium]